LRRCSSALTPAATQAARMNGSTIARTATIVNSFDVQPPHFRYQPKQNARLTAQPVNKVTAIQSMWSRVGRGGRSGRMNRRTRGIAKRAKGTLIQKIQR